MVVWELWESGVPLLGVPGISWWACGCEGGKKIRAQVGTGQKQHGKKQSANQPSVWVSM